MQSYDIDVLYIYDSHYLRFMFKITKLDNNKHWYVLFYHLSNCVLLEQFSCYGIKKPLNRINLTYLRLNDMTEIQYDRLYLC